MKCPDCGADVAEELDACPQCRRVVRTECVFSSSDPVMVAVVQSVLDSAGVDYMVFGRGIQGILPADALGGVSIRVPESRAAEIRRLLGNEIDPDAGEPDDEWDEDDFE